MSAQTRPRVPCRAALGREHPWDFRGRKKKKKALGFQPSVGSLETPLGEGLSEGGSLKRGQGCGAPDSPAVPLQC